MFTPGKRGGEVGWVDDGVSWRARARVAPAACAPAQLPPLAHPCPPRISWCSARRCDTSTRSWRPPVPGCTGHSPRRHSHPARGRVVRVPPSAGGDSSRRLCASQVKPPCTCPPPPHAANSTHKQSRVHQLVQGLARAAGVGASRLGARQAGHFDVHVRDRGHDALGRAQLLQEGLLGDALWHGHHHHIREQFGRVAFGAKARGPLHDNAACGRWRGLREGREAARRRGGCLSRTRGAGTSCLSRRSLRAADSPWRPPPSLAQRQRACGSAWPLSRRREAA